MFLNALVSRQFARHSFIQTDFLRLYNFTWLTDSVFVLRIMHTYAISTFSIFNVVLKFEHQNNLLHQILTSILNIVEENERILKMDF